MNKSIIVLRLIVFLLSASILFMGCHSFYEIPKEEYGNIDQMDKIKVVYKNGKEFVVEKDDTTNVKIVDDSLVVYQGTEKKVIRISEVEKIRESRFDFGATFSLIVGTLVLIILLMPPFKVG